MLKIRTYLDKSSIEGIGLFAGEDIPNGTIIWEFTPNFDVVIDNTDNIAYLLEVQREFVKKYAFFDKQTKQWILGADNDRFTNHSESPNTIPMFNGIMVAAQDIKKGEEITCNYFEIDEDANDKF